MPEITIRAGHRLRVWLTSDVLIPTPYLHHAPLTRKDSPMHHRTLIAALLVPLLTLAAPAPASAQIDFGSWFQRATIIANQITQISHQVTQIRSLARQLTELEDQLDHMERAAKGEIDALLAPFSRLAADPVGLVRDGLGWRARISPGQARRDGRRRPVKWEAGAPSPDSGAPPTGTADRVREV